MKKVEVQYNGWGEKWSLGTLAEKDHVIYFEYTQEAIKKQLEFSPFKVPLKMETYSDFPPYQMNLPGFISDSLPDGWGLMLIDKFLRKKGFAPHGISPLDRLLFLGDRAMGALSFSPAIDTGEKTETRTLLELAEQARRLELTTNPSEKTLQEFVLLGGSPQGARPKVLLNYDDKTHRFYESESAHGDPWLFKFPASTEHKEVCALEMLYYELAKKCRLEMTPCKYFDLDRKLSSFGTKRFDRIRSKSGFVRVPMTTLAGVFHLNFRIPSSIEASTFLRVTRAFTQNENEVEKAYDRCVFNVIFHNRDDHPKNFSYILDDNQRWVLAPAYDLNFNEGPGGEHQMDILGEGRSPNYALLESLAVKSGLDPKRARHRIDEMRSVATAFAAMAKEYPIRKKTIEAIKKKLILK